MHKIPAMHKTTLKRRLIYDNLVHKLTHFVYSLLHNGLI